MPPEDSGIDPRKYFASEISVQNLANFLRQKYINSEKNVPITGESLSECFNFITSQNLKKGSGVTQHTRECQIYSKLSQNT